jgi:hypothetical protein
MTATAPLTVTGTWPNVTVALTGTVGTANGGTGVTAAPAANQVLLGTGSGYALTTLVAGNGVTFDQTQNNILTIKSSGGTGSGNGGTGGNGGPAIALNCNNQLTITNNATGKIVGGGGGCGGQAGNNRGGGQGGNGGTMLTYSGSHPAVTAINAAGGILAGGGGGAGGWGNRYEGEGHGGYYGTAANSFHWTGAGSSPGSGGQLSTNNATTLINSSSGTYVISPAV